MGTPASNRGLLLQAFLAGLVFGRPLEAGGVSCLSGADSQIEQYGVTFRFDKSYPCGTFANGDYWVSPSTPGGIVFLTEALPSFDGSLNGWQVNPSNYLEQSFDSRVPRFVGALVPALPYSARGGQSLVKAISVPATTTSLPFLKTAVVLTVLDQAPPAVSFRPAYFGTDKRLRLADALKHERIPRVSAVANAPTLAWAVERYRRVQLDHMLPWEARALHPVDNMSGYGASMARDGGDALMRLLLDGDSVERTSATIHLVQAGIDIFQMYRGGLTWPPSGGHGLGRKTLIAFAATLLDDEDMIAALRAAKPYDFGEDGALMRSPKTARIIWGSGVSACTEQAYWHGIMTSADTRDCRDPYLLIDGGERPGDVYQNCCASQTWKGDALVLALIPHFRCAFNNEGFLEYVSRWVSSGAIAQPDECAPYDGVPSNYGVTFGPDGREGAFAISKRPAPPTSWREGLSPHAWAASHRSTGRAPTKGVTTALSPTKCGEPTFRACRPLTASIFKSLGRCRARR